MHLALLHYIVDISYKNIIKKSITSQKEEEMTETSVELIGQSDLFNTRHANVKSKAQLLSFASFTYFFDFLIEFRQLNYGH